MVASNAVLIGYAVFLFIMLVINLLYFFQVFKYRLPGDASIGVLFVHIVLMASVLTASTLLIL
ncbi:MAG: hypothetical protein WEC83_00310 [Patescibacteria group bacterium]